MSTNIVHKITLNIPADSYENAVANKVLAENWTKYELAETISEILDSFDCKDIYHEIDKIEIEIFDLPWNLSSQQLQKEIKKVLLKSILQPLPFEKAVEELNFFLNNATFQHNSIFTNQENLEIYLLKNQNSFIINKTLLSTTVFASTGSIHRLISCFSSKLVVEMLSKSFSISISESTTIYNFLKLESKNIGSLNSGILKFLATSSGELCPERKTELIAKMLKANGSEIIEDYRNPKHYDSEEQIEYTDNENFTLRCKLAGIVLLLPFLYKLFENLSLVEEQKFVSDDSRKIAIHLLVFLATGKQIVAEEDCLLPKLLCGFQIADSLDLEFSLSEEQMQECENLLQSVIEHWKSLRNTSVNTMREEFLQREGRIKITDTITLEVENSGIDILLNNLPWGFRNYKLPWMKKTIDTQWY